MDLAKFYHDAERCPRQEDVEADESNVNAMDGGGLPRVGYGKDKRKRKADSDFGEPK